MSRPLVLVLVRAGLALALVLTAAGGALAEETTVLTLDWSETLRVESAADHTTTHPLATIEHPPVGGVGYALVGRVRHEGVVGEGYLEMWSHFADGGAYFSRTLGQGAMASLSEDGGWREFQLPFQLRGAPAPTRLQLNLVLPAQGRVWIESPRLLQLSPRNPQASASGSWWNDVAGGWIGGILGSAIGVLGGLIGTLCSLGRGREFVLGALRLGIALGVVLSAAGSYAWIIGQPYAVWYPLLLIGVLCAVLDAALLPGARRRFEELELRRMLAQDAAGI